jgi:hypothetical protein
MSDGETPHYLVDLDLDLISDNGIGNEYHKSFNSGNAVAFAGNVFNFNIILFSNRYWCSWSGSATGRSFFASEQIFTVLRENRKTVLRDSSLAIRLLNPFAHYDRRETTICERYCSLKRTRNAKSPKAHMQLNNNLFHFKDSS